MNALRQLACLCRSARSACAVAVFAILMVIPLGVARAQLGACCFCTGQCTDNVPANACATSGGLHFPNQSCSQIQCREWGACCLPSGTCFNATFFDVCSNLGGSFAPCQDCATIPCGGGEQACCFCDGICIDLPQTSCIAQGGTPTAGLCASVTCPKLGACCFPDTGQCVDNFPEGQCPAGFFFLCAPCSQTDCGPQACCRCDGTCLDLLPFDCAAINGMPQGPGTNCNNTDCIPFGACCFLETGLCSDNVLVTDCPTVNAVFYPCQNCADIECGEVACCLCDGLCAQLQPPDCIAQGGMPQPAGSTCATTFCARFGACCVDGVCFDDVLVDVCNAQGGQFFLCQDCTNVNCEPVGACCFTCEPPPPSPPCPDPRPAGPPCVDGVTKAVCELTLHGIYRGDGTVCQIPGGPPLCRCRGDLNGDGRTNAADFAILAGMFNQGVPNCKLHSEGDLNCDGIVNAADFTVLAGDFGCVGP